MYSGTTTGLYKQLVNCGLGLVSTDFPSATTGSIALIERGGPLGSTLALKTRNAMRAGAVGVVFYDNTSGTTPPNSLISRDNWIPAVFLPRAAGLSLLAALPTAVTLTSKPTGTWTTPDYLILPNAYVAPAGTSTATPFVSAAVAFAAANFPAETAVQRVARVLNGTTPVGALSGRVLTGGRLDLTGIVDPDHDQMPDWWETEQFGNTSATANADPDGDGFTNLQEYRTGTLPNNPFSRFTISQSGRTVAGGFSVTFATATEVTYRVETSETLAAVPWTALGPDIPGTGSPVTVTDANALTSHPRRFYRVRIISP
jgi:subtilisin family serine protease